MGKYSRGDSDENETMLRFLYTYRNFEIISNREPGFIETDNLKMCRADFVRDAVYNAFRLDAPEPSPENLTLLGYCVNNEYYYFTGGYTDYFATDVTDISAPVSLDDDTMYVIYTNTYRTGISEPVSEYGFAHIGKDSDGYFMIRLKPNCSLYEIRSLISVKNASKNNASAERVPLLILSLTVTVAAIIFYLYFLRN